MNSIIIRALERLDQFANIHVAHQTDQIGEIQLAREIGNLSDQLVENGGEIDGRVGRRRVHVEIVDAAVKQMTQLGIIHDGLQVGLQMLVELVLAKRRARSLQIRDEHDELTIASD